MTEHRRCEHNLKHSKANKIGFTMSSKSLLVNINKKVKTTSARKVWQHLNGIINVYKPAGISTRQVKNMINAHIRDDVNSMDPEDTPRVNIKYEDGKYSVETYVNSEELDRLIGPRYTHSDIRCNAANHHGKNTSGVMILGINDGTRLAAKLSNGPSIQTYHVSGKFGKSTETNFKDSLLTNRASYDHIFSGKLTSAIASMQASHQRKMFEMSGVDIQSQAAYELACKGPIRPVSRENPLIYGMECIEFKRPDFTLEIQAMNANEEYLCSMVAEIGLQMRSVAHCTKLRCTRYGFFTFEDSLLRSHWRVQDLLQNMVLCQRIVNQNPSMLKDSVSTPVGHGEMNETG